MESLWQDVKYGARMLTKSPGFTAVAVLSLAIGVGANTTIYSFINALLLKPLPGRDPGRLVSVYTSDFSGPRYGASSYLDLVDFRDRSDAFDGLLGFAIAPMVVTGGDTSDPVLGAFATGSFFDVLDIRPRYGRFFLPDEDVPGAEPVAVLSHGFWQRHFGADPAVVGTTVRINAVPATVVGIAPEGFNGLIRGIVVDAWVPMHASASLRSPAGDLLTRRGSRALMVYGRLAEGVSHQEAEANLQTVGAALHLEYPSSWTDVRDEARVVSVLPEDASRLMPRVRGAVVGFMAFLMVVVGLVLLLACTNTANLLLARAAARRKEIATRLSLGAGRTRLVRQLLTEAVLLAGLAGGLGVLFASWSTQAIMAFQPPLPVAVDLGLTLDRSVMAFAVGLSLATGVLFGLVPALQASRADLVTALRADNAPAGRAKGQFVRGALVVGQVAISVLLLVGAGLFLRSLNERRRDRSRVRSEQHLDGFRRSRARGLRRDRRTGLARIALGAARGQSAVDASSVAENLPLGIGFGRRGVGVEDYEPGPGEDMEVHFDTVGPRFFETMRIPLVRGRDFTEGDIDGAPSVVVVNEAFARRYWPGVDPMGKHVLRGDDELEVVGIAKDGKYVTLGEDPRPYVYYPHRQHYTGRVTLLVRTDGAPESFAATLQTEVGALDSALPVFDVKTMSEHMGIALLPVRIASSLLGIFGVVALVLATGGLYGVMSYLVGQRTHEIGVRVSLGAAPSDIVRLVLRQGMTWTLVGSLIGLAAAIGVTRFLTFLLYGISPSDPLTFFAIATLMATSAFVACYVPGRRATRVDPLSSLRSL